MTARRWLFVLVFSSLAVFALVAWYAIKLANVVSVTDRLVVSYELFEQWQGETDPALRLALAQRIDLIIPSQLGPAKLPASEYTAVLSDPSVLSNYAIKRLRDGLVWELFECHRLQTRYHNTLIWLALVVLLLLCGIGAASYYVGRRAEDYRLAPFPEANPNVVLGLNGRGDIIYSNRATQKIIDGLQLAGSELALLPEDYRQRLLVMFDHDERESIWTHQLSGRTWQYRVQRLPEVDRIHVYAEDITEQEEIRSRNAFIAYHDPVTLLANRQKLEQVIEDLQQSGRGVTLVMSQVHGMAQVFSTSGTSVADHFARELSYRLRSMFVGGQTLQLEGLVFRFDTNLFGCLYFDVLTDSQHQALSAALPKVVQMPFRHGRNEYFFSLQSGVASLQVGQTAKQLIQQANLALHSLFDTEHHYQCFDQQLADQVQQHHQLEQALRRAIELDELEMMYQPQQALVSEELVGFEALMRWRRDGEWVSPSQFIPLAERTGLIHTIGHWGFREVLRQVSDWCSIGGFNVGKVAVNVSSPEFTRLNFIEDIEAALRDFPVNPSLIQIELTESVLLEDVEQAIERMRRLKQLGFSLAIDDFGTGYSSFSYLSQFPIDKLKIDRSFIVNMANGDKDVAIVLAMINVAHQLGIRVIAEGVETVQQSQQLKTLGCDEIQGYSYGKPMTVAQATLFTKQQKQGESL